MNRKAIIVLGMHRSGTSILAAAIQAMGVYLGDRFFEPEIDNPKGNYENREITLFNEKLLNHIGASWDNLAFGEPINYSDLQYADFMDEAKEILMDQFSDAPIWGIKDPRMCLLLPFWQDVIRRNNLGDIHYVHIFRNPIEVSASHKLRHEHMSTSYLLDPNERHTLLLWFSYYYQALRNIDNNRNILVAFSNLFSDPLHEMERIGKLININIDHDKCNDFISHFIDKSHRHYEEDNSAIWERYASYPFIRKFYSELMRLSKFDIFTLDDASVALATVPEMPFVYSFCAPLMRNVSDCKKNMETANRNAELMEKKYEHLMHKHVYVKRQYFKLAEQYFNIVRSFAWFVSSRFYLIPGAYFVDRAFRRLKYKIRNLKSSSRPHVIVIDYNVPEYDRHAGARHTYMYLQLLVNMGYRVSFISRATVTEQRYVRKLNKMGIKVISPVQNNNDQENYHVLLSYADSIEFVFIHRPHVAEHYIDFCKNILGKPVLYMCHDIQSIRLRRQAEYMENNGEYLLQTDKQEILEKRLFEECDFSFTPSSYERAYVVNKYGVNNIEILPVYIYKASDIKPWKYTDMHTILFVGSFGHPPNVDGVAWFISEVMPMVINKHPDTVFNVVGSNVPDSIMKFASKNVVIHGHVNDEELINLYTRSKVVVIPLRYGAGVKGKLIETLFYGVPIVSTTIGLEGIDDVADIIEPCDYHADFAERLCRFLSADKEDLLKISLSYQNVIREKYTDTAAMQILNKCIDKIRHQSKDQMPMMS